MGMMKKTMRRLRRWKERERKREKRGVGGKGLHKRTASRFLPEFRLESPHEG